MSTILAHRANIDGPAPAHENSQAAVLEALSRGWGIETDIRRADDGRFYISHDRATPAEAAIADSYCALFRAFPAATIALNVKEVGYEEALIAYLDLQGVLRQVFLFDMELIESHPGETARLLRRLHPEVRIAARVSDRGESIDRALAIEDASVVWLDEYDDPWCTREDVERLARHGRHIYAVSPELHHVGHHAMRRRWANFLDWGIDGICTDFPAALAAMVGAAPQEITA